MVTAMFYRMERLQKNRRDGDGKGFPDDQWSDIDGDGYGDNLGNNPDLFNDVI